MDANAAAHTPLAPFLGVLYLTLKVATARVLGLPRTPPPGVSAPVGATPPAGVKRGRRAKTPLRAVPAAITAVKPRQEPATQEIPTLGPPPVGGTGARRLHALVTGAGASPKPAPRPRRSATGPL